MQVDNVMRHEHVLLTGSEEGGWNRAVLPKHKTMSGVKDVVAKFSKGR